MSELLLFFLGASLGSFLYCLAMTYQRESIFSPRRSRCEVCGHELKFWQLIPIISFLFIKGRCIYCHQRLSMDYLFIEVYGGCLFLYFFLHHSATYSHCLFMICLLMMACFDLADQWVADILQVLLLSLGLLQYQMTPFYSIQYLLLLGLFFLLLICLQFPAIGGADLKVIYCSLFFIPAQQFPNFLLVASTSGLVYLLLTNKNKIPFVPFLVMSLVIFYP